MPSTRENWESDLERDGFLAISSFMDAVDRSLFVRFSSDLLSGKIDASDHRHDLGSSAGEKEEDAKKEFIPQIMWPSLYLEGGTEQSALHRKVVEASRLMLGDDMEFDFDMIIAKDGHTDVETPWHQDESYWLDLPDKRALSFWFPMQDVNVANGCMWFVPGSHLEPELRPHRRVKEGHHLRMTDHCSNSEGVPQPIPFGGCTVHTGRTLHYTGGNKSDSPRVAYIINTRPKAMIALERKNNYDHGRAGNAKELKHREAHQEELK